MREAVIVSSSRTPLAKPHRGSFNTTRPDDLAAHCITDALRKAPGLDAAEIEEVLLGCGQPHGPQGHNIARVAALRAGLPVTTPGVTVNRFCNSGPQAIVDAAHMVVQEGVEAAIGGGVESITMLQRDSSPNPWVQEQHPGLYMVMGETAEVVAKRYGVTRLAQDEYSLISQQRVARASLAMIGAAWLRGHLLQSAAACGTGRHPRVWFRPPVSAPGCDHAFRYSALSASVKCPFLRPSPNPARLLLLSSHVGARGGAAGGRPHAGCEPDEMGIGPVFAVPKLLRKVRLALT